MARMIRSMSGYGRGAAEGEHVRISVEVRAVNHRFCRVSLNLPAELSFFEPAARRLIGARIQRGKIDLTATVTGPRANPTVHVDGGLAGSYRKQLREVGEELGIEGDVDLAMIATLPGVVTAQMTPQLDPESDLVVAESALEVALDALDEMRVAEGEHLADDVTRRFDEISTIVGRIEELSAELPVRYRDQLATRLSALCKDIDTDLDPNRLAQEVAYYADRSDVTEELVRLRSHVSKAEELLSAGGAVGRSLEFLLQELHREINTIGSKAKAMEVADIVIDLKSELERIREQVQNIE